MCLRETGVRVSRVRIIEGGWSTSTWQYEAFPTLNLRRLCHYWECHAWIQVFVRTVSRKARGLASENTKEKLCFQELKNGEALLQLGVRKMSNWKSPEVKKTWSSRETEQNGEHDRSSRKTASWQGKIVRKASWVQHNIADKGLVF